MATPPPTEAQDPAHYRLWASLQADLLNLISSKLTDVPDYLNFRAVCNPWRSSTTATAANRRTFNPLILLPHDPHSDSLSLLHLPSSRIATARLPETRGKVIVGSSFGWLALVSLSDNAISLFNPFTRAQIPLPQLVKSDSPRYNAGGADAVAAVSSASAAAAASLDETDSWAAFLLIAKGHPWKISLSANPSDGEGYIVTATLSCAAEFAVLRPDVSDEWILLTTGLPWPNEYVAFYKPILYVLDHNLFCTVIDLSGEGEVRRSDSAPDSDFRGVRPHIVKIGADLMTVMYTKSDRIKGEGDEKLKVLRLEEEGKLKWQEVTSIGEYAIFLSGNQGFAMRAAEMAGVRADCIYFSAVYGTRFEGLEPGFHYVDVFDLKEGKFERARFPWASSGEGWRFDTWITPCLHDHDDDDDDE